MKIYFYLLILFVAFITDLKAQKGFQFGVGAGHMILEGDNVAIPKNFNELSEYRIKGDNPYYFEVKADYAFTSHFQFRSGIQWRWRNISLYDDDSDTRTMVSVPLIANFRLPINGKRDIIVGLNFGIAIDNYIPNSTKGNYDFESNGGSNRIKVTNAQSNYIYNGNFLSFNGSFRLGIEVEKDFGTRGRIGLQVMYNYERGNSAMTISELTKTVFKSGNPSVIDYVVKEKIEFDEEQTGYQIGLTYYFGQFNANKK